MGSTSERSSSVVIGLSIAKATATVSLLCDDGSGAFAAVEAAAGGCAVGVGGAWASDELGALGACVEGDCAFLAMVKFVLRGCVRMNKIRTLSIRAIVSRVCCIARIDMFRSATIYQRRVTIP